MNTLYKFGSIGDFNSQRQCRCRCRCKCRCKTLPMGMIHYCLENQTLQFSNPETLNDINEAVPDVGGIMQTELTNLASKLYMDTGKSQVYKTIDEYARSLYESREGQYFLMSVLRSSWKESHKLFRSVGILSLTSNPDNLLMWAHYTNACAGMCIGFDPDADVFTNASSLALQTTGLHSVKYSEKRANFDGKDQFERLRNIALTKSVDWKYESEVRCFKDLSSGKKRQLVQFKAADVREIIMGPNMPLSAMLACRDIWQNKYAHAKLKLALPDPERYEMCMYVCTNPKALTFVMSK